MKAVKIDITFKCSNGSAYVSSFKVFNGENAFEIYRKLPGNENKTLADFHYYVTGYRPGDIAKMSSAVTDLEEER